MGGYTAAVLPDTMSGHDDQEVPDSYSVGESQLLSGDKTISG